MATALKQFEAPHLGIDNSHLIESYAENPGFKRFPELGKLFKAARAAIESVLDEPLIEPEKRRRIEPIRVKLYEDVNRELAKNAQSKLTELNKKDGLIRSVARKDDLIRTPGVAPCSEDEHRHTRRVL